MCPGEAIIKYVCFSQLDHDFTPLSSESSRFSKKVLLLEIKHCQCIENESHCHFNIKTKCTIANNIEKTTLIFKTLKQ